nr:YjbQ family protein [Mesotoga sp. Brook.08.YT.4.2.5.1]
MKSYRKELFFNTATRREIINITPDVERALKESGIQEGLLLVNAMHITASVFINDNESGLHNDFEKWLESLRPRNHTRSTNTTDSRTMRTPT